MAQSGHLARFSLPSGFLQALDLLGDDSHHVDESDGFALGDMPAAFSPSRLSSPERDENSRAALPAPSSLADDDGALFQRLLLLDQQDADGELSPQPIALESRRSSIVEDRVSIWRHSASEHSDFLVVSLATMAREAILLLEGGGGGGGVDHGKPRYALCFLAAAWSPLLNSSYVVERVVRVVMNFLIAYDVAASRDALDVTPTSGTTDPSVVRALGLRENLYLALQAFLLAMDEIVPRAITAEESLSLATTTILLLIYPNALSTGKRALLKTILAWLGDLWALSEQDAADCCFSRIAPSVTTGAFEVYARLDARYWVKRLDRIASNGGLSHDDTTLLSLLRIFTEAHPTGPFRLLYLFNGGSNMADPLQSALTRRAFLASPCRAPMLWPPLELLARGGHLRFLERVDLHSYIVTSQTVRTLQQGLQADQRGDAASRGSRPYSSDPQSLSALARSSARHVFRTPTGLLLDRRLHTRLPLCWMLMLQRAKQEGALKNQDRWWLTYFVLDTLGAGGEEGGAVVSDVVDIEDLVGATQTICTKKFGAEQAAHIRGKVKNYEEDVVRKREGDNPSIASSACVAMRDASVMGLSADRGAGCPFAAQNRTHPAAQRASLHALLEDQLNGSAEGRSYLAAHPNAFDSILDFAEAANQEEGCLAHYNMLLKVRHGERAALRTRRLVYPVHFAQFQAMRDTPSSTAYL
jgi:hypothetical protein